MIIYNSLTKKKELLKKPKRGPLKLFVCGPTVYDAPHLGHAKTYIAFDMIVRYLKERGVKVFYIQNITDVDDKIIERSKNEKKTAQEIARHFEKIYYEDMKKLRVDQVDQYARASDFIGAVHSQIRTLVKKGFAYRTSSGVYFEIKKFPRYGKLSRQNIKALRPGWRIEPDLQKRDPIDFALWKLSKEEPNWPSPWGDGRPGWHIEDTAITEKMFGPQYDLHGGGVDLKFPHHESEIAQQEAASGKSPFVKIWLHTGFLLINNEKMAKSLKNFITVQSFLEKYPPEVLRFIMTSNHYRSPLNYTNALGDQAQQAVAKIIKFLTALDLVSGKKKPVQSIASSLITKHLNATQKLFIRVMDDDFNTPKAMAALFSLINGLQKDVWKLSRADAHRISQFIQHYFGVLGIFMAPLQMPENIRILTERRETLRSEEKFEAADALRDQIKKLGYEIEDTPAGPLVSKL